MSKVDDELTRRLHRAERPVDGEDLFEGVARRRSHRERVRRVQGGLLAFAVLTATAGGFVFLRQVFDADPRDVGERLALPANGEIVFSREGPDGRFHLFASQPDGSGVRQITDDATNDTDPAVSPGGETIGYVHELDREVPEEVSEADPPAPGSRVIATVPIEGGIVSWHTPDHLLASDPAWSPDGTQIAFVGQRGTSSHLYVVGVDSLVPEPLTSPLDVQVADPTWSPDGARIAFALRGPAGPWGLASIHPDGTGLEPLRTPDGDEEAPAWSPDGLRIAFLRTGVEQEIRTIAPDGGGERVLASWPEGSLETDLTWAPDGRALLVSDGEWIYPVDPTPQGDPGAKFDQLVRGSSPAWQPLPAGSLLSPTPTPAVSPSPEPAGRDIGLGFLLCNLQRLDRIDWYGNGADGSAWTGTRMTEGECPAGLATQHVVAVDLLGNDLADTWASLVCEGGCQPAPFDNTDLDRDGVDELIVIEQHFSAPNYRVYTLSPFVEREEIAEVAVTGPGHSQNGFVSGEPAILSAGGDAGISDSIRCIGWPGHTVIEQTRSYTPIDGDTTDVHYTRLVMERGGFRVIAADDFTQQASEPVPGDHQETPCGVDFDPGPP